MEEFEENETPKQEKARKKDWRVRYTVIGVILALSAGLGLSSLSSCQRWLTETKKTATAQVEKGEETKEVKKGEIPSPPPIETSRKIAGGVIFIIFVAVLGLFIRSNWEANIKWYKQKLWGHRMFLAIYVIIGSNLVIFFLTPEFWKFMWGDQLFFWSLYIGLVIFVGLKPISEIAAYIFGAVLVIGLGSQMARNPYWKNTSWSWSSKPAARITPIVSTPDMDTTLRIIAECESGNRHFDESGGVIRNTNGTEDPSDDDIGRYQINLKHQADIIKRSGLDVYDETGNRRIAELVITEKGKDQWNPSRGCWGPKLAALTNGERKFELTVQVPVKGESDEWSETVKVPPLTSFSFRPKTTERRRYLVKPNNDSQKIALYDSALETDCFDVNGAMADKDLCLPPPISRVSFQSADDKPLEMVVKFFPYQGN